MTAAELPQDIPDLYESEKKRAEMVQGALQRRYATENLGDDKVQQRFIREAKGVFAENGLIVSVLFQWDDPETGEFSPTVSDNPADNNIYYIPRIRVIGRTEGLKEYDHDQESFEVRAGVLDGKKGVIDINTGELKEDPKSKMIF